MYKSESSLIWAKLNYIWVYCKRSSVFLIMFCNMICPSMACVNIKKRYCQSCDWQYLPLMVFFLSCPTWIRTKTNRTKTCCATITP